MFPLLHDKCQLSNEISLRPSLCFHPGIKSTKKLFDRTFVPQNYLNSSFISAPHAFYETTFLPNSPCRLYFFTLKF